MRLDWAVQGPAEQAVLHVGGQCVDLGAELRELLLERGAGGGAIGAVAEFAEFLAELGLLGGELLAVAGEREVAGAIEGGDFGIRVEVESVRGDDHVVALEGCELVGGVFDEAELAGFPGTEHEAVAGGGIGAAGAFDGADALPEARSQTTGLSRPAGT